MIQLSLCGLWILCTRERKRVHAAKRSAYVGLLQQLLCAMFLVSFAQNTHDMMRGQKASVAVLTVLVFRAVIG